MLLSKGLVVSCQALEDEPLHSSFIMGRMAKAALVGGAQGIRANSVKDVIEIQSVVDLPIIGIIKQDYEDSDVFITPTLKEVVALAETGVAVVALDATQSIRPNGQTLEELVTEVRKLYPNLELMADCSTYEEAIYADKIGFDYIGTTLVGYTKQSQGMLIDENDFELIKKIIRNVKAPVVAEGNIDTPQKARRVLELGCYSVVVGSAITRPQLITKKFSDEINKGEY